MRPMHRWLLATTALVMATPIGSATANTSDKSAIAIVAVEIRGTAEPTLRTLLQRSVVTGLEKAEIKAVTNDAVIKAVGKRNELLGCTSASCLNEIGGLTKTKRFLRLRIEADGAAYKVALELLDQRGQTKHRLEQSCEVCTLTEVSEIVRKRSHELVTTSPAKPVSVEIVSRPEGAKLSIDGNEVGQAPYQGKLTPGKHTVKALLAGHTEVEKVIEVKGAGDKAERFELILTPVGAVDGGKTGAPKPRYRVLKWAAAGGAVVGLVTGFWLVSIHDDPTCTLMGVQEQCPDLRNTMLGGVLTIGAGITMAAASTWMFMQDRKSRNDSKKRAVVLPTRGGAMGAIGWSW